MKRIHGLTRCQLKVIRLIGEGKGHKKIADELRLSIKTVESHCQNAIKILRSVLGDRLGQMSSHVMLVHYAIGTGLV